MPVLPLKWYQNADPTLAPLWRSRRGSITPIRHWLQYADHPVAPLRRSVTPGNRRRYLPINAGSNRPCRSRGIDSSSDPSEVSTVFELVPLRWLATPASASSARCTSISALSIRSANAFFKSPSKPPDSSTVLGSRPAKSSSKSSLENPSVFFFAIPAPCPPGQCMAQHTKNQTPPSQTAAASPSFSKLPLRAHSSQSLVSAT